MTILDLKPKNRIFHSWELVDNNIAIKTVDKSVFAHSGTGVPLEIRDFFEVGSLSKKEKKLIRLIYKSRYFEANIEMDSLNTPRSRIIWKSDFRDLLREQMSLYFDMFVNDNLEHYVKLPKIRFEKINNTDFNIDFLHVNEIEEDINEEAEEYSYGSIETRCEGKVKYVYSKQYERDSRNRIEAIKYHGTKCGICGFDFEEIYGTLGKGYIEIHHVNPLSTIGGETEVNPKTDLIPVCSNCHKIIHRRRDNILSIEEMISLLRK